jgi:hypothetical protein
MISKTVFADALALFNDGKFDIYTPAPIVALIKTYIDKKTGIGSYP